MQTEAEPEEITNLVGREVYSNNGVFVGEVEDIQLNLNEEAVTALAVTDLNPELFEEYGPDRRGVLVPYRWVRAVGDIVIVNEVVERVSESESEAETIS